MFAILIKGTPSEYIPSVSLQGDFFLFLFCFCLIVCLLSFFFSSFCRGKVGTHELGLCIFTGFIRDKNRDLKKVEML